MNKLDIENVLIHGCEQWIRQHRDNGWIAYYVNFMFEPLQGTAADVLEQMKKAIYKEFYVPFMMRFVRDPHRKAEQEWMPRLMLFPDRPAFKGRKTSVHEVTINSGGLHYNGFMLIPPVSRFWDDPVAHIEENRSLYCRNRISRIHAVYLDDNIARVGEALGARLRDLHLSERTLYLPDTKTGTPRPVYLPPVLVDALMAQTPRPARPKAVSGRRLKNGLAGRSQADAGKPFLERGPDAKLFRFHASGRLRGMLARALKQAGLSFPRRQGGFHLFCHTYGTWMHHYGQLDTFGLVRTNRWKHPDSADRYRHTKVSEEARKADLLPVARKV